jgi:hypothetical protein
VNRFRNKLRVGFPMAAIALLCLPACGSDDSPPKRAATGAQGASTQQPTGSLAPQEFRPLARAMSRLKRSKQARGVKKSLAEFSRACRALAPPPSPLLKATYEDCDATVAFLELLVSVPQRLRSCGSPTVEVSLAASPEFDPACFKGVLGEIRGRAQASLKTSKAVNDSLAERQIRGRCRRLLGTSRSDLRNLNEVAAATDELDRATDSPDRRRINKATKRFQTALDELFTGPDEDPLKLLRSCRP